MDEKPKHRWFQFRLSTWFVLVAILAWVMALWPYFDEFEVLVELTKATVRPSTGWIDPPYDIPYGGLGQFLWFWKLKLSVEQLEWPAVALAAFLAWKAAWALGPRVVRRRRARTAE
ncbi:MAG: hypothetical protein AB7O68_13480 [Pirellulales bacterium]